MFELTGKVALVTGGSRGIGRAIAIALAGQGAKVAVNYVSNAQAAAEVVERIAGGGGQAVALQGDVASADDAKRIVEETAKAFDGLHILVNNAGLTADDLMLRMSEEAWDRVMSVNLRGAYLCTKAALRPMIIAAVTTTDVQETPVTGGLGMVRHDSSRLAPGNRRSMMASSTALHFCIASGIIGATPERTAPAVPRT